MTQPLEFLKSTDKVLIESTKRSNTICSARVNLDPSHQSTAINFQTDWDQTACLLRRAQRTIQLGPRLCRSSKQEQACTLTRCSELPRQEAWPTEPASGTDSHDWLHLCSHFSPFPSSDRSRSTLRLAECELLVVDKHAPHVLGKGISHFSVPH